MLTLGIAQALAQTWLAAWPKTVKAQIPAIESFLRAAGYSVSRVAGGSVCLSPSGTTRFLVKAREVRTEVKLKTGSWVHKGQNALIGSFFLIVAKQLVTDLGTDPLAALVAAKQGSAKSARTSATAARMLARELPNVVACLTHMVVAVNRQPKRDPPHGTTAAETAPMWWRLEKALQDGVKGPLVREVVEHVIWDITPDQEPTDPKWVIFWDGREWLNSFGDSMPAPSDRPDAHHFLLPWNPANSDTETRRRMAHLIADYKVQLHVNPMAYLEGFNLEPGLALTSPTRVLVRAAQAAAADMGMDVEPIAETYRAAADGKDYAATEVVRSNTLWNAWVDAGGHFDGAGEPRTGIPIAPLLLAIPKGKVLNQVTKETADRDRYALPRSAGVVDFYAWRRLV